MERGNQVMLAAGEGESYIYHPESATTVPMKKRGRPFVIETRFAKKATQQAEGTTSGFARMA